MVTHIVLSLALFFSSCASYASSPAQAPTTHSVEMVSSPTELTSVTIRVALQPHELLYHDSVFFSTDTPDITVTSWESNQQPQDRFDKQTNTSRESYQGTVLFTVHLSATQAPYGEPRLLFHYMLNTSTSPQEALFHMTSPAEPSTVSTVAAPEPSAPTQAEATRKEPLADTRPSTITSYPTSVPQMLYQGAHNAVTAIKNGIATFKSTISTLFTTTHSRALQLLLALLLGILMSLTPCIYPMIPVTVGLLGTSAEQSVWKNFLLAFSYTLGLATIFSVLGLLTAHFGAQCGQLTCNPWVILLIVFFLGYCGGSMLGWYDFYVPRFLIPSNNSVRRGSHLSAFIFGAVSGTIASPCMSPGLALILSAVASLGNYTLGFLMLFVFGIGSSFPLLIIGTFSGSLHLLPRAGMWMNEVKKFFGFMLIMMCFYYLQGILPLHWVMWSSALFCVGYGLVYLAALLNSYSTGQKIYAALFSTLLLSIGIYQAYIGAVSWQASTTHQESHSHWQADYATARVEALHSNKLMLLDFTASWCSLCQLLDKQVLQNSAMNEVYDAIVPVKVDGSSRGNEQYQTLTQQYKILGLPTLLLIDPATETIIKKWNSELLEQSIQSFIDDLMSLVQMHGANNPAHDNA